MKLKLKKFVNGGSIWMLTFAYSRSPLYELASPFAHHNSIRKVVENWLSANCENYRLTESMIILYNATDALLASMYFDNFVHDNWIIR